MMKLCVVETSDGVLRARENEQRLLRNMDVHVVVLELLRIPYDKVGFFRQDRPWFDACFLPQAEDTRMNRIMRLAHNLLQYFCYENPTNQAKLYDLYFNDYQQISEVKKKMRFFLFQSFLCLRNKK